MPNLSSEGIMPRPSFDPRLEAERISRFIRESVSEAKVKGVVIGISGGIDSAASAFLAVKALGRHKVLGLLLFEAESSKDPADYKDAKKLIAQLGIKSRELSISPVISQIRSQLQKSRLQPSKVAMGNIKARTRMILLYAFGNHNHLLVLGTGDRSEEEIGYFTKYGDGGVDLQPIAHLYKTEVRDLARALGVPNYIIQKPSSPRLWKGHAATDEIPADYPELDKILALSLDWAMQPRQVAKRLGISIDLVKQVLELHKESGHKRDVPPQLFGLAHG